MAKNRERYEFIEAMFDKLDGISVERIIGSYMNLVHRGRHWMGLCPFHKDTKLGSFVVTPDRGIWKCFSCGDEYAGNGVKFVSLYKNLTYLEAAFQVALDFGLITNDEFSKYSNKKYDEEYLTKLEKRYSESKHTAPTPKKANPVVIRNVYQCLKDNCTLSENHRNALVNERKLSDERIEKDYFTCPYNWKQKDAIVAKIKESYPAYNDEILKTVPGFFYDKKHKKITFSGYKGLCILIRNVQGEITGIQIRRDTVKPNDQRYIWFSSVFAYYKPDEYEGGCSCGSPLDVAFPLDENKTTLCITEGKFKLEKLVESGNISISAQGVTTWKEMSETIKNIQKHRTVRNVYIFFDADILGKHELFSQSLKMVKDIKEKIPEINIRYAFWSAKNGKGIDDCIIAGNMKKIQYFYTNTAERICTEAYQAALKKYKISKLQELDKEKAEEFKNYLQNITELLLGLK